MWLIIILWCFQPLLISAQQQNLQQQNLQQKNVQQPLYNNEYNTNVNSFNDYISNDIFYDMKCPEHWVQFQQSCYRFVKSPLRSFMEAQRICKLYTADNGGSDLVSISSSEEHGFLIHQLNLYDPQHRRWYIGAHQQSANYWLNPDGSQLANMENAFLPELEPYDKNYLAYNFSQELMHWGFQLIYGNEPLVFICEANIQSVQRLVSDDRTYTYGIDIEDPERIPRGPYFIKEPIDATFDTSKRNLYNDISLSCLAGGYPTPEYEWYREDYQNDRLVAHLLDPLQDSRYTVSGGMLIIHDPQQERDFATYHCKAKNKFGTIISESVQLNFGFILEFVLKRSPESGEENWGKSIYCDPPNHFPAVRYSWSRDYFPNFVEEDKRVFVSYDGALYFSALEQIDRASYSCSVQSEFSDSGRNGPFFPLRVNPHSNYQELRFPNNFPKAFPEAPIAGKEVRLECVAFGYPVPSYNWTRKVGNLPRNSYMQSYNRILIIPNVQVEDQGEYVCRIYNDRASLEHSVVLNIQAEPNFTIPLRDKHIDRMGEFVWTCEAFGIPDVNYTWWKNGRQLVMGYLEPEDHDRIRISDNVLTIRNLDDERDPGMYQCRASNTLKTKYSSAQLRVLAFKPSFKKHPVEPETYAAEQGNVTIKCNPEAAPKPGFTWKKDGNVIAAGGHRRILDNGNLIISPVSRDDEGLYTCTASNALGIDESKGRLIILRAPRIEQNYEAGQYDVRVSREFRLFCEAYTEEMLDIAYIWNHNGMRIRDIDVKQSNHRLILDGGFFSVLNSTFSDAGEYECVVKSAVGKISRSFFVNIQGPPGPPGGVQVLRIERNSATLQWTDGGSHGPPIQDYMVTARTNRNDSWIVLSDYVIGIEVSRFTQRKEATIENLLTPWSVYEFRIAARNEYGFGPPSAPSPRHTTPADRPYISPENIGGGGGKIGDLTITWTPLRPDQQNGPDIYYKIFWKRRENETEFQQLELKEFGNTGQAVVHIPYDQYYSLYRVKVQAINEMGPGPISEEHLIYSAEDMPQVAPQLVVAKSFNSTALRVSWVPIDQTREKVRGKLIGHRVKYWKKGILEEDSVYYLSRTTTPWALIVGLQPDTYYIVKVMVFNAAGEGPESERFIERTYRKAPQKPPSSVHVYGIDPSTVKVVWRYVQPTEDEEPLQGYKIRVWEFDQDISTANDTIIPFGGPLEAYVNNLTPGKSYRLRVLAYSLGGDGRMSSPELKFQMGELSLLQSNGARGILPYSITITMVALTFVFSRLLQI